MLQQLMRPHLQAFLHAYKELSFKDYFTRLLTTGTKPSAQLCAAIMDDLKHTYGAAAFQGRNVERMLLKPRHFFVANHGGIENHPQLIAASLLTQCAAATLGEDNFIFSCNLIHPQNQTAPLGFYLPADNTQPLGSDIALNFISRRYNNSFIYSIPALNAQETAKKLTPKLAQLELDSKRQAALLKWRLPPGVDFCAQGALHNTKLYAHFLQAAGNKTYFINEERVALKLLLNYLNDPHSLLFKLLFTPDVLLALMRALAGAANAWDAQALFCGSLRECEDFLHTHDLRHFGTALFYFINERGDRHCMILHQEGNQLTLRARNAAFALKPEVLYAALEQGRLLPNLFLVYFILSLCAHATLIGGPFFAVYSQPMLTLPAQILKHSSVPLPQANLLQSFILPFKVQDHKTRPHALLQSDLMLLPPLEQHLLEKLMHQSLASAADLSIAEELLRLDLNAAEISANEASLRALLDAPCTLELEL